MKIPSFIFRPSILCLLAVQNCHSWHAYKKAEERNSGSSGSTKCDSFENATQIMSSEEFDRMRLWPGLMKPLDVQQGETVYGFTKAMQEIWKNQFPQNCSEAKFVISGGWPYGFGSRIHTEGWGLAVAMQLGRVFLPHPDGDNLFWETSVPFCRDRGDVGLTCFYEKWSNCTMQDALMGAHGDVNSLRTFHPAPDFGPIFDGEDERHRVVQSLENDKAINMVFTTGHGSFDAHLAIPYTVREIVECSPIEPSAYYYWWRAISATFIARPNQATLDFMSKFRTLPLHDHENCIAMFVRHGDKGMEMELKPSHAYFETAQYLWDHGFVPGHGPPIPEPHLVAHDKIATSSSSSPSLGTRDMLEQSVPSAGQSVPSVEQSVPSAEQSVPSAGQNGTIFLTTDDPNVIAEADAWGKENGWKILYTNLFDRGTQTFRLDWNEQHKKGTKAVHDDLEYISMLLNLEYALRCEAWVCTLASNSCRLIDEMRTTVGGKANRHYADLSKETCTEPPCIGFGIYNFFE